LTALLREGKFDEYEAESSRVFDFNAKNEDDRNGFGFLALTFTLAIIRLDVDIVPRFYALNILAILFSFSIFYLFYRPFERMEEKEKEKNSSWSSNAQKEKTNWLYLIFAFLLITSLLSGYFEYQENNY
jgi:NADH:ubiquinone oxidoreductase subunit 5 (subunit L)/multisubunit Na+/H+ antiporter MnhA subunit